MDQRIPAIEIGKESRIKPLYRGIWADHLQDGDELPVGGLVYSRELTTKLLLDFSSFSDEIVNFGRKVNDVWPESRVAIENWLRSVGSDVDPYLFFCCHQVNQKVQKLLEVDLEKNHSVERMRLYNEGVPKLSSLRGISECAERAALGQYLLREIGIQSAYMSGIRMLNATDAEEFPEDHSFIVMEYPIGSTFVFDISVPISEHNLPRISKTDTFLGYDAVRDRKSALFRAKEVLRGKELWYGVGDSAAGGHKVIV